MSGLVRNRRGVAAVETAIVLALLITPLLSVTVGLGQGMLLQYRVDRALHAGLVAAWGTTGATGSSPPTAASIQTAAQNGYGTAPPTMTATATYACYCITDTSTRSGAATVACASSGTCGSGLTKAAYVTLTTSDTYTPIFTMNWGSGAWTVSATGTVRVPP